jgi:hypothetical protein
MPLVVGAGAAGGVLLFLRFSLFGSARINLKHVQEFGDLLLMAWMAMVRVIRLRPAIST